MSTTYISKDVPLVEPNNVTILFESVAEQVYYFNGTINDESVKTFMSFYNNLLMTQSDINKPITLNLFLESDGGLISSYTVLKTLLENSPLNINLIATSHIMSSAFLLFYKSRGINKYLTENTVGLIHTLTRDYNDRDLRNNGREHSFSKKCLDSENEELLRFLKDHGVVSQKQIAEIDNGEDVYLTYAELDQIMRNCPYGNFRSSEPDIKIPVKKSKK